MFDITPINTPLSVFATAKNTYTVYIDYIKDRLYSKRAFKTMEDAEKFIKEKGLTKKLSVDPRNEGEYKIEGFSETKGYYKL